MKKRSFCLPFIDFTFNERILWVVSVLVVIVSNIASGDVRPVDLIGQLVGVTGLIYLARGDVTGQVTTIAFSILYGITSYSFRYYGEMITYLGMTMPIAIISVITWLRNPSGNKNEVAVSTLSRGKVIFLTLSTIAVTVGFGLLLDALGTPNVIFSTVSVTTSYLASALMMLRLKWYAVAYAMNDIVLIILWTLASFEDIAYISTAFCFLIFLANDIYGFVSWNRMEKSQTLQSKNIPEKENI